MSHHPVPDPNVREEVLISRRAVVVQRRGVRATAADVGLLLLRLFTGLSMALAHGWMKVQNPGMMVEGAKNLGFPMPAVFGWASVLAEFAGGLLIALGLLTRPAAFFIACTMATAAFKVHAKDPYQVKELAFVYLAISLALLLIGPGRFSIDALIFGRRRKTPLTNVV